MEHVNALPAGTRLGEYEVVEVLGAGGFGLTYRAWDTTLEKYVAIKEYLPRDFATRTNTRTVVPTSQADRADYEWGLKRFLDEARTLARFDHPHINKVHRFFEAHGTAYLVLEYIEGETLGAVLQRQGRLDEAQVLRLLGDVLSGLEEVHAADYVHRDIKPGNLMVKPDGSAVVLDFGAARQAVGQRSKSVTSILTPGYAPLEQYDTKAEDVGPWSDIYALGMVAYRCISGLSDGELPDAVTRSRAGRKGSGDLEPAASIGQGRYDARLLHAIDWAIQVEEDARPQNIAEWQQALPGLTPSESRATPAGPSRKPQTETTTAPASRWALVVGVVALMVAVASGAYWYARQQGMVNGEPPEVASGPAVAEPGGETRKEIEIGTEREEIEGEGEKELVEADGPSAEGVEAGLGLDREARRLVQQGLLEAGQEPGPADGLFGEEETATRQAIRAWQAAKGMEASGYLTREQADALIELGQARADDAAYAAAEQADTAEGYEEYLRAYPSGRHAGAARERQAERVEARQRAEAARVAQADEAAYAAAEQADTAEAYAAYLQAYPAGRHMEAARTNQQRLQAEEDRQRQEAAARAADNAAYAEAETRATQQGYQEYLRAFPAGRHAKAAVYKWCMPKPKRHTAGPVLRTTNSLDRKIREIMDPLQRAVNEHPELKALEARCDSEKRTVERAEENESRALDLNEQEWEAAVREVEKADAKYYECLEPYNARNQELRHTARVQACEKLRDQYPFEIDW